MNKITIPKTGLLWEDASAFLLVNQGKNISVYPVYDQPTCMGCQPDLLGYELVATERKLTELTQAEKDAEYFQQLEQAATIADRQPTESEVRRNNQQLREFYRPLWDEMWYAWLKDKSSIDVLRIKTFVNQGWRPLGHIGTEDLGITFPSEEEVTTYVKLITSHLHNYNAPV